jgi:hypothetical protein
VLTSIKPHHIRILKDCEALTASISSYGAQSWRVLEDIFQTNSRPQLIQSVKDLNAYFDLINNGNGKTKEALELREKLEEWLADDPALVEADMLLAWKERLRAKKAEESDA